MKSVTRKTALFLTLALSLATVGCGEDTPKAAESDQRELLNNASTLTVTGDLDDIVLDSDLTADGTVAGRIVERGIFNTKWTITSGGEPWFYIAYPKENGSITWKVSIPVIHMDITIWMTTAWGMHRSGSWKAIHWSGLIILSFWMQREMLPETIWQLKRAII